ncbi:MAG: histidine phosphatase family protein [Acidimicrobiales bacterium]
MPRLLLVRHAQSTWNAEARWQGWADAPLSEVGRAQAEAMAGWLAGMGLALGGVASSDLQRALDTARIVADRLGAGTVTVDTDLRERDVGDWTGRTTDEIDLIWPGAITAWRTGLLDQPPGGEHEPSFRARAAGAVHRLAGAPGDDPVLVVTHGGVIRAIERHLGGERRGTPNLAGRWMDLDPDSGELRGGDYVALPDVEDETVTRAL